MAANKVWTQKEFEDAEQQWITKERERLHDMIEKQTREVDEDTFDLNSHKQSNAFVQETINRQIESVRKAWDHTFLFILATMTESNQRDGTLQRTKTTQAEARDRLEKRMNNLIQIFNLTRGAEQEQITEQSVTSVEGLQRGIRSYLNTTKTMTAYIFFIGRKSDTALHFLDEPSKPNDEFLDDVRTAFIDTMKKRMFPRKVQIVFTQCQGHSFSSDYKENDKLYVHSLTRDSETCTISNGKTVMLGARIGDSNNVQQNDLGHHLNQQDATEEFEENKGEEDKIYDKDSEPKVDQELGGDQHDDDQIHDHDDKPEVDQIREELEKNKRKEDKIHDMDRKPKVDQEFGGDKHNEDQIHDQDDTTDVDQVTGVSPIEEHHDSPQQNRNRGQGCCILCRVCCCMCWCCSCCGESGNAEKIQKIDDDDEAKPLLG